jgi:hydrogenase expression/formation protein HypD
VNLHEFRSSELAQALLADIRRTVTRRWTIMEVCGGQTHAILHSGIDQLLPREIHLIHGPGCPVCVTPISLIDAAIEASQTPGCTLATFGDMLRVPGTTENLFEARASGGQVKIVTSALKAVAFAQSNPNERVVFFAIGFETTAPSTAVAVTMAARAKVRNFKVLSAHVLVTPAMTSLVSGPRPIVQAYLAAGHVSTILGSNEYIQLAEKHRVPVVVTGFEPLDILLGIQGAVRQLEAGVAKVENMYARVVREEGNPEARKLLSEVFESEDREWRGIGMIPKSGLRLNSRYHGFSYEPTMRDTMAVPSASGLCLAGEVLQGLKRPVDCPSFGTRCTPAMPLGAPMVSTEGSCAAYYAHARRGMHGQS